MHIINTAAVLYYRNAYIYILEYARIFTVCFKRTKITSAQISPVGRLQTTGRVHVNINDYCVFVLFRLLSKHDWLMVTEHTSKPKSCIIIKQQPELFTFYIIIRMGKFHKYYGVAIYNNINASKNCLVHTFV